MKKIKTTTKQKNVLLIDNNKILMHDIQDYMERNEITEKYGLDITFAKNANEALKKITEKKIDLVVLEIILPIVNGYYLIKAIKKEKIPIVIYTKIKSPQDLAKMASMEVDNIFVKDLMKMEDLIKVLAESNSHKAELDRMVPELQSQIKALSGEEKQSQLKMVQCPRCHIILPPDSHFCNNCGQKIFKESKKLKLKNKDIKQKQS